MDYRQYRGNSRGRRLLRIVLLVLLAVSLLTAIVIFCFQEYIVYADDGTIRLNLPFLEPAPNDRGQLPTDETIPPTLIIEEQEEEEEEETEEPEKLVQIGAMLLRRSVLLNDTVSRQLDTALANAAIFDMKTEDGRLVYLSPRAQAEEFDIDGAQSVNDAIARLSESDVYSIARLSCFVDNGAPRRNRDWAIQDQEGGSWRDQQGRIWLNPMLREAQEYLIDIAVELAELGFDEILLDHCAFPVRGHVEDIQWDGDYAEATFTEIIPYFVESVAAALADYDVVLSVMLDEITMEEQGQALSGQTLAGLLPWIDRVWTLHTPDRREELAAIIADADVVSFEPDIALVSVFPRLPQEKPDFSWAVLS